MDKFIEKNKRRSFVVLEIGASCGYDFYYPQSNGFMGVKYQGYLWPFTFSKI